MTTVLLELLGDDLSAPVDVVCRWLIDAPSIMGAEAAGHRVLVDVDAADCRDAILAVRSLVDSRVTPSVRAHFAADSGNLRIRER